MNKTKIISGILFAGLAAGLLVFAQDRPDGDKDRKGDRDRDEPRGDRERDKPRREGDRERDRDRDEPRGDEPRREGDRERDGQHREIEAWLEKREAEINALRKQGKLDRAEALAAETKKVLERYKRAAAERREERDKPREDGGNELERWVQQQERKIAELREAGKKEAAAELQQLVRRKIAEHHKHAEREHGERGNIEERVRHIQAAIEHLQAAGLHDWAKELTAHVDREHHNKREQGEHAHGEHEHDHHEDGANNLRREVEELKRAIRAIQKHLKERDR
jgi:hypothetical protein